MTGTYRIAVLTTIALIAFAANSIFCRFALGDQTIDAASFTTVRLVSGALTLACIVLLTRRGSPIQSGNWTSASMLFLYAVTFSFAYVSLSAGTGALILFGAVQITMILSGLIAGERPRPLEWIGLLAALTATRAATVQLAVPVIAAIGGIFFLAEAVTLRLTFASIAILGGVGLAISSRTK